jgi:hypothetical protein
MLSDYFVGLEASGFAGASGPADCPAGFTGFFSFFSAFFTGAARVVAGAAGGAVFSVTAGFASGALSAVDVPANDTVT